MNHRITVIRDPSDGTKCLICSCGYSSRLTATIDLVSALDHQEPMSVPPPVDLRKFVSGLPDKAW